MTTVHAPSRGSTGKPSAAAQRIADDALRTSPLAVPTAALRAIGDFYAFCLKVFGQMFTRRFRFREFVSQAWFITNVSVGPAVSVGRPFCIIIIFEVNQLLIQI